MNLSSRFVLSEQNKRFGIRAALTMLSALSVWVIASIAVTALSVDSNWRVLEVRDGYEIRAYDNSLVAQVRSGGSLADGVSESIDTLLRYIRGDNTVQESVAVHRPAGVAPGAASAYLSLWAPMSISYGQSSLEVSVQLPRDRTIVTAPRPSNPRVRILQVPSSTRAVLRDRGPLNADTLKVHEERLRALLARDNRVIVSAVSATMLSPQWAPSWLAQTEYSFVIR